MSATKTKTNSKPQPTTPKPTTPPVYKTVAGAFITTEGKVGLIRVHVGADRRVRLSRTAVVKMFLADVEPDVRGSHDGSELFAEWDTDLAWFRRATGTPFAPVREGYPVEPEVVQSADGVALMCCDCVAAVSVSCTESGLRRRTSGALASGGELLKIAISLARLEEWLFRPAT